MTETVAEKLVPTPPEKVMVTASDTAPDDKAILTTKKGAADIQVVVVSWWAQVLIRTLRTYLQSLLGFVVAVGTGAAGAVGINVPMQDFGQLLLSAASLAVAPAVISLLQNAVEMLSRLDTTNPQLRG